jgi:hypothetical protein
MTNLVFNPTGSLKSNSDFNDFLKNYSDIKGEKIIYINCNNYLGRACHVKENYNYDYNSSELSHKIICKICIQKQEKKANKIEIDTIRIRASEDCSIQNIIKYVDKNNFHEYYYEKINFGLYTTYDLIVKYKLKDVSQVVRYWNEYRENLRNAIRTYLEVQKILQQKKVERLFVYNSLYSANRAAVEAANKYGIKCFTVNKGYNVCERETSYIVTKADIHPLLIHIDNRWQKEISFDKMHIVLRHMETKMSGTDTHSYSTKKTNMTFNEIRNKLGVISKFEKTCVVLLSSEDEYYATSLVGYYPSRLNNLFSNQIEWLEYIKKISLEMPNVLFIIRMHPREYPNSRSNTLSLNVNEVISIFPNTITNVVINTPSESISVYDLIECADLLLNMSSSLGAEVAYLKKPVLGFVTERLVAYPSDIHKISSSLSEYCDDIQNYLWMDETSRRKIVDIQYQNSIKWFVHLFETRPIRFKSKYLTSQRSNIKDIFKAVPKSIKKFLGLVIFWSERVYTLKSYIDEENIIKLDKELSK